MASIHLYNSVTYGEEHADQYLDFLSGVMDELALEPEMGLFVEGFPGVRTYTAKSNPDRQAHGYRIVFRVTGQGIEIIRILHTAMQWEDHIPNS